MAVVKLLSLAAFMRKTSKVETRNYIVTELCKRLSEKNDNVRDIAASGKNTQPICLLMAKVCEAHCRKFLQMFQVQRN
jgi:hypothetical protein